ncbi:hypothetical protein HY498_05240 [Candidatus Woesearchaeota archaeon]|nr:hypothetical protein [Candidatus Woesearchaeota archaeon]
MKCPTCSSELRKTLVKVYGAENQVISYQCIKCDYFEFEKDSSKKVIEELRESPLKLKQKIIKLSHNRLGMYFNKNIIESIGLKKGENLLISVPDKKHILIERN